MDQNEDEFKNLNKISDIEFCEPEQSGPNQVTLLGILIPLLLLISLSEANANPLPISEVCPHTRKILVSYDKSNKVVHQKNLCSLVAAFPGQTQIAKTVSETLNALKSEQGLHSITYIQGMSSLAAQIDALSKPNPETKNSFAIHLNEFAAKYSTEQSRLSNPQQYQKEIVALIQQSKTGKKVYDCWQKNANSALFLPGNEVLDSASYKKEFSEPLPEFTMMYTGARPRGSKLFRKVIVFNPNIPPIEASISLIHEMQHGCDAIEFAKQRKALEDASLSKNPDAFANAKATSDQTMIGLEARGYTAGVNAFREFATAAPSFVCTQAYVSGFLGTEVITLSDYHSFVESGLKSDEFFKWQAMDYVNRGVYDFTSVFQLSGTGPDPFELKPEVKIQIKRLRLELGNGINP